MPIPIPDELPLELLHYMGDPGNWVRTEKGKLQFLDIERLQKFIRENVPQCNEPWFANRIYEICLHPTAFNDSNPTIATILAANEIAFSKSRPFQVEALTRMMSDLQAELNAVMEDPIYVS